MDLLSVVGSVVNVAGLQEAPVAQRHASDAVWLIIMPETVRLKL